jgi:hypothetical protein
MQIPVAALIGKTELPVKCPDSKCGGVTRLKKNTKPAGEKAAAQAFRNEEID